MSIRIHAAGSDNFRYTDDALPFGEVYQLANLLSIVSAGPPRRVVGTAIDSQTSAGSPAAQGIAAVAQMQAENALRIGIFAVMEESPAPLLFVAARESHFIGPDTGSNLPEIRLNMRSARSLMRELDEVLASADLDTTGAIFGIGTVFSLFAARRPKRARPARLNITLSH